MFKNTNPVFSKVRKDTSDQAISYGASYQGVILKTALLFILIVASAFGSFFLLANYPAVYILGLIEEKDKVSFFNDKLVAGSLTMTSVKVV